MGKVGVRAALAKVAYHAIEVTRCVVRLSYGNGNVLADDLGEIDWVLCSESRSR